MSKEIDYATEEHIRGAAKEMYALLKDAYDAEAFRLGDLLGEDWMLRLEAILDKVEGRS